MPEAGVSSSDDTRRLIMDTALDLFQTQGMRRTTIEEIARTAGMGRPTLYRRFSDKDAIIQAVLQRESRRLIAQVWDQVKGIRQPEEALVASFMIGLRIVSRHPLIRRLLDSEPELILPFLTIKAAPSIDIGHALIGEGARQLQAAGYFPGMKIDYLLEILARLFISILITPSAMVDVQDDDKLESLARDCLVPLLSLGRSSG